MGNATQRLSFSQAVGQAIRQEMRRDPSVVVIGEDVAGAAGRAHLGLQDAWGGPTRSTRGLVLDFGEDRVIDAPISEMGFTGAAVGRR
jgi:pyruvate dehydrogenase E1 component beta subunit